MALTKLTPDGHIEWFCHADERGYKCEYARTPLSVHMLDEQVQARTFENNVKTSLLTRIARVLSPSRIKAEDAQSYGGMVIALPACSCGSQCFLKADYTRKDLLEQNVLLTLKDDAGEERGSLMALPHVRNLRLHHLLHQAGKVGNTPILPDLPVELQQRLHAVDLDMLYSLWFSYVLQQEDTSGFEHYIKGLIALNVAPEPVEQTVAEERNEVQIWR